MDRVIIYFKKNIKRSHLILLGLGLILILGGFLSWNLYFSKYYAFKDSEDYFLERVKNYYKYFSVYLPKEGKIKVMTLEEMYEKEQMDALKDPSSNKLCDASRSWVKVYNDGDKYHYYTYLKCGKYESKIDHTGPEITLKGDNPVYVSLNKEYVEAGVEKIVDDSDGNIEISKVVVDNSKVNTKKVGKYNVTYTVRDKLNNETKLVREVIVTRNLTDVVIESTDDSNYFKGEVTNNYILFSGMMYRIINVNSDGTVKLISNENLNNLAFNTIDYSNSNVDKFLNSTYLDSIYDDSYLVNSEYCVGNIDSRDQINGICDTKIERKVGILSYQEYLNTLVNDTGYLCNQYNYALANRIDGSILLSGGTNNSCTSLVSSEVIPAIRPVITLKSDLIIVSGDGTQEKPYKLNDYNYAKQQDKISTRIVGEYVNYSGYLFRIMGVDKNKNVKMISLGGLEKNAVDVGRTELLVFNIPNGSDYYFNTTDENNPGYIINNQFIDYINDKSLVSYNYDIPVLDATKNTSDYSSKASGKAKIVIAKTYDLFASVESGSNANMYLYLDSSTKTNNVYYLNAVNGRCFETSFDTFGGYSFKSVVTIKGDSLIRSGKGTLNSPYYIY